MWYYTYPCCGVQKNLGTIPQSALFGQILSEGELFKISSAEVQPLASSSGQSKVAPVVLKRFKVYTAWEIQEVEGLDYQFIYPT